MPKGDTLLIGIDLGTTALKVAAYNARTGVRVAGEAVALRVKADESGRREQSPEAILKALRSALGRIAVTTRGQGPVCGVGLASQGGSGIVVKRASGKALTPMTLWNDARAFPRLQEIADRKPARFWRTRSSHDGPGMGLARLSQLVEDTPDLVSPENVYAGAGDYVYYQLTGQWRQDACHALQTGCYDTRKDALSKELAAIAGVPIEFFPALRRGHQSFALTESAAARFGLPEGIPVAGPYMDHEAGFLSAAHVSKRPLQCSLGTAWVGNFVLPEDMAGEAPFQLSIPSPLGQGRLVIQPLLTGNVTWDWALQQFVNSNAKRALEQQAAILDRAMLPPEGFTAIPWLNRPHPLSPAQLGACSFVGAGPATTGEDFIRAVVAGMAYELHRIFAHVASSGAVDSLVLSGGASKSPHFRALIAALFDPLPVFRLEEEAWMGTRGGLWAFQKRAAGAKASRVKPEKRLDSNALAAGRTLYGEVFDRLYRQVRAGAPYTVQPRESAP